MAQKILMVGFVAGLVALALLVYPLGVILPGRAVSGWMPGSLELGIALVAVAALVAATAGTEAARRVGGSRLQGMGVGAAAGGIAGMVAFAGAGAAAASVLGMRPILVHGPTPAADNTQFLTMLVESVVGVTRENDRFLWGMGIGGAILGLVGGLLVKPSRREAASPADETVSDVLALAALLGSLLNMLIVAAIFSLLPGATERAAESVGLSTENIATTLRLAPLATAFAFVALSAVWVGSRALAARRSGELTALRRNATTAVIGGAAMILTGLAQALAGLANDAFPIAVAAIHVAGGAALMWLGIATGIAVRAADPTTKQPPVLYFAILIGYGIAAGILWGVIGSAASGLSWTAQNVGGIIAILVYGWLLPLLAAVGFVIVLSEAHRRASLPPPPLKEAADVIGQSRIPLGLGLSAAMLMPGFGLLATALGLVLGPIVAIEILANFGLTAREGVTATWTSAGIAQSLYLTIGPLMLGAVIVEAILMVAGLAILGAVMRRVARRTA